MQNADVQEQEIETIVTMIDEIKGRGEHAADVQPFLAMELDAVGLAEADAELVWATWKMQGEPPPSHLLRIAEHFVRRRRASSTVGAKGLQCT